MKEQITK